MADIPISDLDGTSVLPRLAPDLSFPSGVLSGSIYQVVLDPSGGLTTALSLSGKFSINYIEFAGLTAETITIKLTIDGTVIWNDTFTAASTARLLGAREGSANGISQEIQCNSSLLLEIQTATDTSVVLNYLARPIL